MARGAALQFPSRQDERQQVNTVKSALRLALFPAIEHAALAPSARQMVRDFCRGRHASSDTVLACLHAVLTTVERADAMSVMCDLVDRLRDDVGDMTRGQVWDAAAVELETQTQADAAQLPALRAIACADTPMAERLHAIEHAEKLTLREVGAKHHLARSFREARLALARNGQLVPFPMADRRVRA